MGMKREQYPHLVDPEALKGPGGLIGRLLVRHASVVAANLEEAACIVAAANIEELPVTVHIDGRSRPSQKGQDTTSRAAAVIATAENIHAQQYENKQGIVIAASVDERDFLPDNTQCEELMRLGVRILGEDERSAVPLGVGKKEGMSVIMRAGNRFATNQALRAASHHIGDGAVGAYGPRVMDRNASLMGMVVLNGDAGYFDQYTGVDVQPFGADNGFMSAAGAVLSTGLLQDYPLDKSRGGEPAATWAANFQATAYDVVYNPAMAVHDASGANLAAIIEEAY